MGEASHALRLCGIGRRALQAERCCSPQAPPRPSLPPTPGGPCPPPFSGQPPARPAPTKRFVARVQLQSRRGACCAAVDAPADARAEHRGADLAMSCRLRLLRCPYSTPCPFKTSARDPTPTTHTPAHCSLLGATRPPWQRQTSSRTSLQAAKMGGAGGTHVGGCEQIWRLGARPLSSCGLRRGPWGPPGQARPTALAPPTGNPGLLPGVLGILVAGFFVGQRVVPHHLQARGHRPESGGGQGVSEPRAAAGVARQAHANPARPLGAGP